MSHVLFQLEDLEFPLQELQWIDVRSEGEFEAGHIPGAVNIPILNNEHRVLVGTSYKQEGKDSAVELGYKLVSPLFEQLIAEARKHLKENKIVIYCARGGMRSQIFSDLLSKEGVEVLRLKDGYKRYRNWCLEKFIREHTSVVLSGKTGSQKTERLFGLKKKGNLLLIWKAWPITKVQPLDRLDYLNNRRKNNSKTISHMRFISNSKRIYPFGTKTKVDSLERFEYPTPSSRE